MNIWSINVSVALMIVSTLVLRKIFKGYLLNNMFCVLWTAIMVRLFVPITLNSKFSFWNLCMDIEEKIVSVTNIIYSPNYISIADTIQNGYLNFSYKFKIIWLLVAFSISMYYVSQYISIHKDLKNAIDVYDSQIIEMINEQKIHRQINIKKIDTLETPATVGFINPIIAFPKTFDFTDCKFKKYVLLHECGHIKYAHSLLKTASIILVCLYWYNPFVWLMHFSLDSNMEIMADRYVINKIGEEGKTEYAVSLISAAENKKKRTIFYYHYKNKLTKERIEEIMKFKKITVGAVVTSLIVPACMVTAFATTDTIITGKEMENMEFTIEDTEYEEAPEKMEDVEISVDWNELEPYIMENQQRAVSSYKITDYKYITYGKVPPKNITVTTNKDGKTYRGTLTRKSYIVDDTNDKYTGYYSGTVYIQ